MLTFQRSLLLSIAALCFSCQRNDTKLDNKASELASEGHHMENKKEAVWQEGAEIFYVLKDQSSLPVQKNPPTSFYVRGKIERGKFKPDSNVLGLGTLATAGRYGWLELNSKNFFPMESDRKAETPFVKGYLTDAGFTPAEREVIDSP